MWIKLTCYWQQFQVGFTFHTTNSTQPWPAGHGRVPQPIHVQPSLRSFAEMDEQTLTSYKPSIQNIARSDLSLPSSQCVGEHSKFVCVLYAGRSRVMAVQDVSQAIHTHLIAWIFCRIDWLTSISTPCQKVSSIGSSLEQLVSSE